MPEPDDHAIRPPVDPWAAPDDVPAPPQPTGRGQQGPQQDWGQQPAPPPGWGQPPGEGRPPTGWGPPGQAWGSPGQAWGPPPPGWGPPPPGWGPPPPDPAAARRKRRLAVGSLAGVVLLLLGTLGAVWVYEDRREERVRAEVAALLPGLVSFVEDTRGLPFREEVDVEVLGDDAFLDALYDPPDEEEPREDRDAEPTLKALGLLEPDADLEDEVTASLDAGVVGFYDPRTDRLVVRGRSVTAFTELVIVHELVHALQDQHFDIDRPELDEADDERSLAFTALVEGDATWVEERWFEEQSVARQTEIVESFGGAGSAEDPAVVDQLLGFPYFAGPLYVAALRERGGQEALDAAYADPPTTSEQILFPDRDAAVATVPAPEPDGDVVDAGVLGVLGLNLLLGDALATDGPTGGWNGDAYVSVEADDRTCTVAHVAVSDGGGLSDALAGWARDQPDAAVDEGPEGTVRLRSCVPA
ncbi:MAG TPA: hypothetical protein VM433_11855 [Mycobacteriales bacterium]|nr:hypothetical protein [Mycobacteriales bacterium]